MLAGAFSPDGTRILTTSADTTLRFWDAKTGEQVDWQADHLPNGELVIRSADQRLIGASPGAWRSLGYLVPVDGVLTRLPAETYGPLPPLPGSTPDRSPAGGPPPPARS